jgi:integrase
MRRKPVSEWNKRIDTVCLGDWAQAYLDVAKSRFADKTYDEKRSMFKRFFEIVSPALPVSQLKPAEIMAYTIKQKEDRSGYAANKDRKNLVAAWNWGMKYMDPPLPGPNPCLVDRMPEERQPRYVPPEEDFWKVFEIAEGQDKVMLLAFLHLAARRSEIFRLTWSDIDFGNNRVRLWTRKRMDGTYEYDWLPMTSELRESLRWWWKNRPLKDHSHVFLCLDETEFTREYYGKPFMYRLQFMRRICDRAKVKRFGFHAIRHLSASILYRLGYEVAVIQAILRHKSPNTTERYLRSIGLERVRDALEDLTRQKGELIEFRSRGKDSVRQISKNKKAV